MGGYHKIVLKDNKWMKTVSFKFLFISKVLNPISRLTETRRPGAQNAGVSVNAH